MLIPTNDIPQADNLDLVVRTVQAVGRGARADHDIADAVGGYDRRQGRYYRRAAEILGFIEKSRQNTSVLTPDGEQFLRSRVGSREQLLAKAVLRSRVIQRVIPLLEETRVQGLSRQALLNFMDHVTATTPSMVGRRLSTIVHWLARTRIVQERAGRLFLQGLPQGVDLVEYRALDEPLLPDTHELSDYQDVSRRVRSAGEDIHVLVNAEAVERANASHAMLTRLVAAKVRAAGAIPKRNPLIDLAAEVQGHNYLFEMKSTTDNNAHSQVRAAISQLYEYRYLQKAPAARMVLVIEQPLPRDLQWMVDYVVNDRKLLLAWDGDRSTLHYPDVLHNQLDFLH